MIKIGVQLLRVKKNVVNDELDVHVISLLQG